MVQRETQMELLREQLKDFDTAAYAEVTLAGLKDEVEKCLAVFEKLGRDYQAGSDKLNEMENEYRKWEGGTNGEWKFINIPFKGQKEGVDYRTLIDPERLKKQEYSLAIVCCSSYYGDFFEGAIDSELTIDDFTIHYEDVPVQP